MSDSNSVKLTREEHLEFENIELKLRLANSEVQRLMVAKGALVKKISYNHGTNIEGWLVNLQEGVAYIPTTAPAPVQPVEAAAEDEEEASEEAAAG